MNGESASLFCVALESINKDAENKNAELEEKVRNLRKQLRTLETHFDRAAHEWNTKKERWFSSPEMLHKEALATLVGNAYLKK